MLDTTLRLLVVMETGFTLRAADHIAYLTRLKSGESHLGLRAIIRDLSKSPIQG